MEIQKVVSIHDLKDAEFKEGLSTLGKEQVSPPSYEPYNLQRLAVLLKTADILHCDNKEFRLLE